MLSLIRVLLCALILLVPARAFAAEPTREIIRQKNITILNGKRLDVFLCMRLENPYFEKVRLSSGAGESSEQALIKITITIETNSLNLNMHSSPSGCDSVVGDDQQDQCQIALTKKSIYNSVVYKHMSKRQA